MDEPTMDEILTEFVCGTGYQQYDTEVECLRGEGFIVGRANDPEIYAKVLSTTATKAQIEAIAKIPAVRKAVLAALPEEMPRLFEYSNGPKHAWRWVREEAADAL